MAQVVLHYLVPHAKGRVLSQLNPNLNQGQEGAFAAKGAACDPSIPLPPGRFAPHQQEYGFTGESPVVNCEACMKTAVFREDYKLQTGIDLDQIAESEQQTP